MISPDIKTILSAGLMNGYIADNAVFEDKRGSFTFKGTSYSGSEGNYQDRWIGKRSGGGQEIVEINGQKYTRLYAGGCLKDEELSKLGITKKQIDEFRTEAITVLIDKTRLDQPAVYYSDDKKWSYTFEIDTTNLDAMFGITSGYEFIQYGDYENVFLHKFSVCPVR